jgi:hypothetical protein
MSERERCQAPLVTTMKRLATAMLSAAVVVLWTAAAPAQGSSPAGSASYTGDPCEVPREYIKLINGGSYDSVGGLFAADAVYMGPDGKTRHGSKQIGAFYSRFLPRLKPQLRAASFFASGNQCVMELENKNTRSGKFSLTAIDHFTIDSAGKVSRFVVYLRPGNENAHALAEALTR